jgi:hypothetical protein
MGFLRIRTSRSDAKYQEAVARDRRKLREERQSRDAALERTRQQEASVSVEATQINFAKASFESALYSHLSDLGIGTYLSNFECPDDLPMPTGEFRCICAIQRADDLMVECKHTGQGTITLSVGSLRGRFRPKDVLDPEPAKIEFIEGTPEGDPRWDALREIASEASLSGDERQQAIGRVLGVDLRVSDQALSEAGKFRAAIIAAGFDEERLRGIGQEIGASSELPDFLKEEIYGEIDKRLT